MGRILDLFINKYNYTDFHELNLDWIISDLRTLAETLENFISLNTIKYADPIQWNITSQYETNTVVIDPNTGTAYLSTQPVPSGVALTNTDYWVVIFDLDIAQANNNITSRDDGNNILSTFTSVVGDWLLWNGTLYKVIADIGLSQAYVPGYNITVYTVEMFIKDYVNDLITKIGDLDDLDTTVKSDFVAAINELVDNIGDLDNLDTTAKDDLVTAINEVNSNFTTFEDDFEKRISETINIKPYIDSGVDVNTLIDTGVALYFPAGEYECDLLIDKQYVTICGPGTIKGSITIDLQPVGSVFTHAYAHITGINMTKGSNNNFAIRLKQARYVRIDNIRIDNTFDYGIYFNETLTSSYNRWGHDIRISDSMLGGGYAVYINPNGDYASIADISFSDCTFRCGSHAAFYGINVDGFIIDGCTLFTEDASGSDSYGIYANNCTWAHITNNNIFEFGNNAIWVDHISQIIIADNSIGYCGEYTPASGIYIGAYQWGANSTGLVQMSDIHDNIIYGATYHGIELALNTGYLKIHDNIMYRIGTSERYFGSVDLTTLNHYGIQASPLQQNNGTQIYNNFSTAAYNIAITRTFCRNNRYNFATDSAELHYEDVTVSGTFAVGHSATAFTIPSVSGYAPVSFSIIGGTAAKIQFLILNAIASSTTAGYLNCYNSYTSALTDDITVRVTYVPVN